MPPNNCKKALEVPYGKQWDAATKDETLNLITNCGAVEININDVDAPPGQQVLGSKLCFGGNPIKPDLQRAHVLAR